MRLISWNVNGIRAAQKGGFLKWFDSQKADIVCVQEVKAFQEQLDPELSNPGKYSSFWHSATKPGYSGTAIFSKKDPESVSLGIGVPKIDAEGRVIVAEYKAFTLINAYFPNSQREHTRLPYKLEFCDEMLKFCDRLRKKGKNVVICGDFNIAHKEIDLKNPKSNKDNAGFLPEERAWMDRFTSKGYVDTFRHFTSDPNHYTWWSYRPGVREKNVGWRIDYFCANEEMKDRLKRTVHQNEVRGSDHCPVLLELRD
jgi:exodeoxyribonuclease III